MNAARRNESHNESHQGANRSRERGRKRRPGGFWHEHSLTLVAGGILTTWIVLYAFWNPATHWGNFFGNAIADWSGVVVMVFGTKFLYERGSKESNAPPPDVGGNLLDVVRDFVRDHSLTFFLAVTLVAWIAVYIHSDVDSKWGQVVGNVVSEWVQSMGMVLLTKRFIERHAKL